MQLGATLRSPSATSSRPGSLGTQVNLATFRLDGCEFWCAQQPSRNFARRPKSGYRCTRDRGRTSRHRGCLQPLSGVARTRRACAAVIVSETLTPLAVRPMTALGRLARYRVDPSQRTATAQRGSSTPGASIPCSSTGRARAVANLAHARSAIQDHAENRAELPDVARRSAAAAAMDRTRPGTVGGRIAMIPSVSGAGRGRLPLQCRELSAVREL